MRLDSYKHYKRAKSVKKENFSVSMGDFTHMRTTPFKMTVMLYEFMKGTRDVPAEGMLCPFVLRPNTDKMILMTHVLYWMIYPREGYLSLQALWYCKMRFWVRLELELFLNGQNSVPTVFLAFCLLNFFPASKRLMLSANTLKF